MYLVIFFENALFDFHRASKSYVEGRFTVLEFRRSKILNLFEFMINLCIIGHFMQNIMLFQKKNISGDHRAPQKNYIRKFGDFTSKITNFQYFSKIK